MYLNKGVEIMDNNSKIIIYITVVGWGTRAPPRLQRWSQPVCDANGITGNIFYNKLFFFTGQVQNWIGTRPMAWSGGAKSKWGDTRITRTIRNY